MRATLLLASYGAHGGAHVGLAIDLAAFIELFQTAALIHDDVIDDSDTRRGAPATHRAFEATHRAQGGHGDGRQFGASAAILAGDLALMASQRALAVALTDPCLAEPRRLAELAFTMQELVTAGQYLDIRVAAAPLATLESQEVDIEALMRSKTASYTVEFPLALGAAAAGATPAAIDQLRVCGVPLGVAFQLRDDVLGLVGDPSVTGKPAGDDLREGKRTAILLHAWRAASSEQRAILAAVVGDPQARAADIASAIDVIKATGALDAAQQRITDSADAARAVIHGLDLVEPHASQLLAIVDLVGSRAS